MSEPWASVVVPAASWAAAPPDEPPGVKSGFHGLRVTPQSFECVTAAQPNSGAVERPWMIAPARLMRSTMRASASSMLSFMISEPEVVRSPLIAVSSLIDHRDAFERARPPVGLGVARLGGLRLVERAVEERVGEGVDRRIDRLGAVDHRGHQLDRRQRARLEARDRLGRRQITELVVGHGAPPWTSKPVQAAPPTSVIDPGRSREMLARCPTRSPCEIRGPVTRRRRGPGQSGRSANSRSFS